MRASQIGKLIVVALFLTISVVAWGAINPVRVESPRNDAGSAPAEPWSAWAPVWYSNNQPTGISFSCRREADGPWHWKFFNGNDTPWKGRIILYLDPEGIEECEETLKVGESSNAGWWTGKGRIVGGEVGASVTRKELGPKKEIDPKKEIVTSERESPPTQQARQTGEIPVGIKVPGKPGFCRSPFDPDAAMLDVSAFAPGAEVICPFTKKIFVVPDKGEVFYRITGVPVGDTLALRSGPGASYHSLAALPNGYTGIAGILGIKITGPSVLNGSDDWVPVLVSGMAGWMRPQYLEPIGKR